MNNVFNGTNQSSGTTDAASGFWGDTNTKMQATLMQVPKDIKGDRLRKMNKKLKRRS